MRGISNKSGQGLLGPGEWKSQVAAVQGVRWYGKLHKFQRHFTILSTKNLNNFAALVSLKQICT